MPTAISGIAPDMFNELRFKEALLSNLRGRFASQQRATRMTGDAASAGSSPSLADQAAIAAAIVGLLKNHSALNIRLKEIPFQWTADIHRLSGKFYYITFANGVPTVPEFVDYIYDCLVPYCLPRRKINSVLSSASPTEDYARIIRLGDDAKALFIRARNQLASSGEPGELILYALLEWALNAPRLVSKMYLKTNSNMPVHGTDGIHLGYDKASDLLTIFFGESKMYEKFSDAAKSAFSSIGELIKNAEQMSREIELLNNLSDLEVMDSEVQQKIIEYIDPYSTSAASLNKRVVHACLIGFEYAAYKRILKLKPGEVISKFEDIYEKRVKSICRVLQRHYVNSVPVTTNIHIFLLPFPSMSDFRIRFFQRMGVQP